MKPATDQNTMQKTQVSLPRELHKKLKLHAAKNEVRMNDIAVEALTQFFASKKKGAIKP